MRSPTQLVIVVVQGFQKDAGVGTVAAMMLPYGVSISVAWILLVSRLGIARAAFGARLKEAPMRRVLNRRVARRTGWHLQALRVKPPPCSR